jgi:hypothetical protein
MLLLDLWVGRKIILEWFLKEKGGRMQGRDQWQYVLKTVLEADIC